jgi:hypothetical protein
MRELFKSYPFYIAIFSIVSAIITYVFDKPLTIFEKVALVLYAVGFFGSLICIVYILIKNTRGK